LLNIVGALVWAILIGTAGYMFGNAVEAVITDIKHYELEVFALVGIVGFFLWFLYFRRREKAFSR
jgi:membrane protein DedA with SNARE-associated domain